MLQLIGILLSNSDSTHHELCILSLHEVFGKFTNKWLAPHVGSALICVRQQEVNKDVPQPHLFQTLYKIKPGRKFARQNTTGKKNNVTDIFPWTAAVADPGFPRGWCQLPRVEGVPTYFLTNFFPKAAWKLRHSGPEGAGIFCAP